VLRLNEQAADWGQITISLLRVHDVQWTALVTGLRSRPRQHYDRRTSGGCRLAATTSPDRFRAGRMPATEGTGPGRLKTTLRSAGSRRIRETSSSLFWLTVMLRRKGSP
jgi:hypothetical protein